MSEVQVLKRKAYNVNYFYLKVLQQYKFHSDEIHYVFEGYEDQSFYFNFLQGISNNYIIHISLGKNNSLALYAKINWRRYDKKRILFFVDTDYSKLLRERLPVDYNIYETTYYSIENYLSNSFLLKRIINEILHYHDEQNLQHIIDIFEREYIVFTKLIKPIIVWILIIRSENLNANLNQIDLSKLISINASLNVTAQKLSRSEYLQRVTGTKSPKVRLSVVKYWYHVVDTQSSPKKIIRGKFDLWYLLSFLNRIGRYLKVIDNHDCKIKTHINLSNAVEILGPRTTIPERLEEFLNFLYAS